jgi:caffeoyl-CoA O-methyltransferase
VRDTHENMDYPQMLTGRLEGRFLKLMVQIAAAKSVLEIGMFTGYSALSMAEGLAKGGKVTTLEIDEMYCLCQEIF